MLYKLEVNKGYCIEIDVMEDKSLVFLDLFLNNNLTISLPLYKDEVESLSVILRETAKKTGAISFSGTYRSSNHGIFISSASVTKTIEVYFTPGDVSVSLFPEQSEKLSVVLAYAATLIVGPDK